jgi:hypothetical protein
MKAAGYAKGGKKCKSKFQEFGGSARLPIGFGITA